MPAPDTDFQQPESQSVQSGKESRAVTRFSGDEFVAEGKLFSFFGDKFEIRDPEGNLRFFVNQKAFKLKEAIEVYADDNMAETLLKIKARHISSADAIFDVKTPDGRPIGAFERQGLKSLVRDEWRMLDTDGNQIGVIEEDSLVASLARQFLGGLLPQTYHVRAYGQPAAVFDQQFHPLVARYEVDFSLDTDGRLDPRMGIAAVVLILAIEEEFNQS